MEVFLVRIPSRAESPNFVKHWALCIFWYHINYMHLHKKSLHMRADARGERLEQKPGRGIITFDNARRNTQYTCSFHSNLHFEDHDSGLARWKLRMACVLQRWSGQATK